MDEIYKQVENDEDRPPYQYFSIWLKYLKEEAMKKEPSDYPKYTKVFTDFMNESQRKKQMAETIFEYTKTPYRFRVRENDFIQNVPKEDWQMIVRDLKSFIMY